MGNHDVTCEECGEDLRGLSGGHARGCSEGKTIMHSEERAFLNEEAARDPDFDELQFVKDSDLDEHQIAAIISDLVHANADKSAMGAHIEKQQKQIDQMMAALADQAATIRRLTVERLGPEKSLYEQAKSLYERTKGLGIGIASQDPAHDPRHVERAFDTLLRAIEAEGYRVLVDPDGVYSVEKKEFDFKT